MCRTVPTASLACHFGAPSGAMAGFYGAGYAGGPYAGMFSAQPPAGAAVMGFPVAGMAGPQPQLGAVDPSLLGELWALDEADFAAVRIETPRGGAGLFSGAAAGYHPALAGLMAAPPAVDASAVPPPWAPPPGGHRLRCLDPTHAAPCHRCVRAARARAACAPGAPHLKNGGASGALTRRAAGAQMHAGAAARGGGLLQPGGRPGAQERRKEAEAPNLAHCRVGQPASARHPGAALRARGRRAALR